MMHSSKDLNGSRGFQKPSAPSQSPSRGTFFYRKNSSSHPLAGRDRGTMDIAWYEHRAKLIKDWHPLFYFDDIESKKFLRDRAIPRIELGTRKW